MMRQVMVLDADKNPLLPCHPAKARKLLRLGKATVHSQQPFTIKLNYTVQEPQNQSMSLRPHPIQN